MKCSNHEVHMNMKIDEKCAIYLKNGIAANILSINLEEIFHIYTCICCILKTLQLQRIGLNYLIWKLHFS